jgi:Flp pilus assembly protein TadG
MVFPIFAIMLFGIIDFGRLIYTANTLGNSAREAARIGSVGNRPTECNGLSRDNCVKKIAQDRAWGVVGNGITTNVTCERISATGVITTVAPSTCASGDLLGVETHTSFTLVTPLIAQFIGGIQVGGDSKVTVNQ